MIRLETPISVEQAEALKPGDQIEIFGRVLCGRDAVLPKIVRLLKEKASTAEEFGLEGAVIFHTAVSKAGIGPTTSNKAEIEESMPELAKAGVRIHVGKGSINPETIRQLAEHSSIFAVTPPVTALFSHRMKNIQVVAFPEEGMEALYAVDLQGLPAIVAAARNQNLFQKLPEDGSSDCAR